MRNRLKRKSGSADAGKPCNPKVILRILPLPGAPEQRFVVRGGIPGAPEQRYVVRGGIAILLILSFSMNKPCQEFLHAISLGQVPRLDPIYDAGLCVSLSFC
jgi:hypothetical protein